jgi:hypothetical protein
MAVNPRSGDAASVSLSSGDRPISGLSPPSLFIWGAAGLIPYVRASTEHLSEVCVFCSEKGDRSMSDRSRFHTLLTKDAASSDLRRSGGVPTRRLKKES